MTWPWLVAAFALFMLFISGADALDRYAESRYGYRPLALPNLTFMLIPHGIALAAIAGLADATQIELPMLVPWLTGALGLAAAAFMLWTIRRRTIGWIAMVSTLAMIVAAPVLLLSMLFRTLAEAPPGDGG